MKKLSDLPNIGHILEEQLKEVGVETEEQLKRIGSRQAWMCIRGLDPSACSNRLCGLEGAILGIRWHDLSNDDKKDLKDFIRISNKDERVISI